MAAVDATNPSLAPSSIGGREFDMVDSLLILRAISDGAESGTATETSISLSVEKLGKATVIVQKSAIGGTVDGSNYWAISVLAADNSAMSDPTTLYDTGALSATAEEIRIPLDGLAAEQLRVSGQDESIYLAIKATETGTTAGDITYGAFVTL